MWNIGRCHPMFTLLMWLLLFFSVAIFFLSRNEKDFENCRKLHGEIFAIRRKKILKVGGTGLLFLSISSLVIEYLFSR
jgi:ABC-type Mn2+/Zn2+ transport system permease subunit